MNEEFKPVELTPLNVYPLIAVKSFYTVIYKSYTDGFVFSGERHAFRELSYVDDGACVVTSDDVTYECKTGDFVLHAPGAFHSLRVEKNENCRIFTVSFDLNGQVSGLYPGKYSSTKEEKYIIAQIKSNLQSVCGEGEDITLAYSLYGVSGDDMRMQKMKVLLELLCLSLTERGVSSREQPSNDPYARCYGKMITFLNENINKNLTLSDVCRGVYESPGKVKAIFHRFTGGGIMKYFHGLRIGRIKELLAEGHSVKDIASVMDFSSPFYLSYYFKREVGMTVRAYLESRKVK